MSHNIRKQNQANIMTLLCWKDFMVYMLIIMVNNYMVITHITQDGYGLVVG